MVLVPEEGDVGQEFQIEVSMSPLFNQTQFTLLVTESSTDHPTTLLGGVPIEFYVQKVCMYVCCLMDGWMDGIEISRNK